MVEARTRYWILVVADARGIISGATREICKEIKPYNPRSDTNCIIKFWTKASAEEVAQKLCVQLKTEVHLLELVSATQVDYVAKPLTVSETSTKEKS